MCDDGNAVKCFTRAEEEERRRQKWETKIGAVCSLLHLILEQISCALAQQWRYKRSNGMSDGWAEDRASGEEDSENREKRQDNKKRQHVAGNS